MNPQVIVDGLLNGALIGLGAVGVTLTYSILRFANFAHGEFITFGAYATMLIAAGVSALVIGSGDGIFAEVALGFRRAGLEVTVVAEPEALSNRLARAACRIINFNPVPPTGPTLVHLPMAFRDDSGQDNLGWAA